jgi:hypothetical protein
MRTNTKRLVQLDAKGQKTFRNVKSPHYLECGLSLGAHKPTLQAFSCHQELPKKQNSFHNPIAEFQAHVVER